MSRPSEHGNCLFVQWRGQMCAPELFVTKVLWKETFIKIDQ